MASTASSPADSAGGLRAALTRLAAGLPPFSPRTCPEAAAAYLDYYGLDFRREFPGLAFGLGAVSSGDHRLAVHCWEQPDAGETLLIVHGYFDHVGLYGHLLHFGLRRGANVVAFDLPGHGISSGPRADIGNFSDYRQAIADVMSAVSFLPGARRVIAQSTGGAALMDYLLHGGGDVFDRGVLLAPLVRPAQWRRIAFAHRLLHRFIGQIPRRLAESSQDPAFLDFQREDPLQSPVIPLGWIGALRRWLPGFLAGPVCDQAFLVVQGDADTTVDWRYNLTQIARLFPASRLLMVPSARHQLANERADLREVYLAAAGEYLDGRDIGDAIIETTASHG